jgi:hypothetical protein
MPMPWRAALCAAPTILVLAGSAWLAEHSRGERARRAAEECARGEVVIPTSAVDEDRMHRVALKHEAVLDLLDGRMTFDQVAARFWDVTAGSAEGMTNLRESPEGSTDEQRIVHQIVAFARVQAARNPRRYGAALARLESEAEFRAGPLRAH